MYSSRVTHVLDSFLVVAHRVECPCPQECPHSKSKTLAEKAAWDFVKNEDLIASGNGFDLVAINPSYIQGPFLQLAGGASSQTLVTRMLNKAMIFL